MTLSQTAVQELTMGQAVREALAEEMRRDPAVFIIGEDVAEAGAAVQMLSGLVGEVWGGRGNDSPVSRARITGLAVGAAVKGMRPGGGINVGGLLTPAMDQ